MKRDETTENAIPFDDLEEKAREAQRAYHREWRKNNPEKVKANRQRYWEKKAREMMTESGEKEGDE